MRLARLFVLSCLLAFGCGEHESSPTPAQHKQQVGPCGTKGLPDCPTQAWMKANLRSHLLAGDLAKVGENLKLLANASPPGYGEWKAHALAGADAAAKGDVEGTRRACAACHDGDRERFRRERRREPLF